MGDAGSATKSGTGRLSEPVGCGQEASAGRDRYSASAAARMSFRRLIPKIASPKRPSNMAASVAQWSKTSPCLASVLWAEPTKSPKTTRQAVETRSARAFASARRSARNSVSAPGARPRRSSCAARRPACRESRAAFCRRAGGRPAGPGLSKACLAATAGRGTPSRAGGRAGSWAWSLRLGFWAGRLKPGRQPGMIVMERRSVSAW